MRSFKPHFARALTLVVAAAIGSGIAASAQTVKTNIDQMSGWNSCTVCAGKGGKGPTAKFSMTQGISSPSMDGKSVRFSLNGGSSFANALWWKQLGAHNSTSHFVYDLYFYVKNPSAAQALEFDVNQAFGGKRWVFGTECSMRSSGTWRVWNASTRWQSTGVPCHAPAAYKWHHLTWEFQRANGKVKFVSVTLDGKKSYINRTYSPQTRSSTELNVAFQMDGNRSATPYSVWLDKVSLKAW